MFLCFAPWRIVTPCQPHIHTHKYIRTIRPTRARARTHTHTSHMYKRCNTAHERHTKTRARPPAGEEQKPKHHREHMQYKQNDNIEHAFFRPSGRAQQRAHTHTYTISPITSAYCTVYARTHGRPSARRPVPVPTTTALCPLRVARSYEPRRVHVHKYKTTHTLKQENVLRAHVCMRNPRVCATRYLSLGTHVRTHAHAILRLRGRERSARVRNASTTLTKRVCVCAKACIVKCVPSGGWS